MSFRRAFQHWQLLRNKYLLANYFIVNFSPQVFVSFPTSFMKCCCPKAPSRCTRQMKRFVAGITFHDSRICSHLLESQTEGRRQNTSQVRSVWYSKIEIEKVSRSICVSTSFPCMYVCVCGCKWARGIVHVDFYVSDVTGAGTLTGSHTHTRAHGGLVLQWADRERLMISIWPDTLYRNYSIIHYTLMYITWYLRDTETVTGWVRRAREMQTEIGWERCFKHIRIKLWNECTTDKHFGAPKYICTSYKT